MFFEKAKDARIVANIEKQRTGNRYNFSVVKCKKYLCYPKEYFGKDYITGFTLVLEINKKFKGNK